MAYSKCIILAFRAFREAADAVLCAVASECFAAACDDLVGICLVADVKYDLVQRRIVDIVKTHNQFDSSETRPQMARVDSAAFYHVLPNLLTEGLELLHREALDVCGRVDFV